MTLPPVPGRPAADFAGWHLTADIPAGWLFASPHAVNVAASVAKYRQRFGRALAAAFPAAQIAVWASPAPSDEEPARWSLTLGVDAPEETGADRRAAVLRLVAYLARAIQDDRTSWLVTGRAEGRRKNGDQQEAEAVGEEGQASQTASKGGHDYPSQESRGSDWHGPSQRGGQRTRGAESPVRAGLG
jgi:hypothetical protein